MGPEMSPLGPGTCQGCEGPAAGGSGCAGRGGDSARSPHPILGLHWESQNRVKNQLLILISRVSLPFPRLECFMVVLIPFSLSPLGFKEQKK